MEKLQKGYLFPEVPIDLTFDKRNSPCPSFLTCLILLKYQISIKHEAHLKKYPDAKVISLGIGDTTEPIPSVITSAMAEVFFLL